MKYWRGEDLQDSETLIGESEEVITAQNLNSKKLLWLITSNIKTKAVKLIAPTSFLPLSSPPLLPTTTLTTNRFLAIMKPGWTAAHHVGEHCLVPPVIDLR